MRRDAGTVAIVGVRGMVVVALVVRVVVVVRRVRLQACMGMGVRNLAVGVPVHDQAHLRGRHRGGEGRLAAVVIARLEAEGFVR